MYIKLRAPLARSLRHVSRANNNRFAVVICFKSALRAKKFKFFENFRVKIFKILYNQHDVLIQ